MKGFSFETQGEMKAYDRGREDAIAELYQQLYAELAEANAFPDADPAGFAAWGVRSLMPKLAKYRKGDDLYNKLMSLDL